jgi:hypothetical protein
MPTTTTYNRGAVVLLPFPFSDQTSAKIRPAVIASPHYHPSTTAFQTGIRPAATHSGSLYLRFC